MLAVLGFEFSLLRQINRAISIVSCVCRVFLMVVVLLRDVEEKRGDDVVMIGDESDPRGAHVVRGHLQQQVFPQYCNDPLPQQDRRFRSLRL